MTFFIELSFPSNETGRQSITNNPLIVGRSNSCDVIVNDPYVSSRHLEFWEDGEGNPFVRDMNSSNGSARNGEGLKSGEPVLLSNGDRVDLADGKATVIVYVDTVESNTGTPSVLPEGTVTFMFTDIVGSTDLVRDLGDIRSRQLFRTHEEILRDAINNNQGFIVKEQGDGFMAVFPSSRAAIISAAAIQKSLLELRTAEKDLNIYVRIGINTGEAIVENEDYFGRAVNEAARISAQANSEEVLVSSISKSMADSAGDIVFGESREIELKGLHGTYLVYPLIWNVSDNITDQTTPNRDISTLDNC